MIDKYLQYQQYSSQPIFQLGCLKFCCPGQKNRPIILSVLLLVRPSSRSINYQSPLHNKRYLFCAMARAEEMGELVCHKSDNLTFSIICSSKKETIYWYEVGRVFLSDAVKYKNPYQQQQHNNPPQTTMIQDRYLSVNKDQKKYKIIIIGDSNVGKTALFWRFTQGDFLAQKDTQVTTIDFKMKNISLHQKPAKLYIWDTAGQQKYRSIVSTYFKGCHGVLMMFDLSSQRSFKNIKEQWYDLCRAKADKAVIMLLGNKSDLERRVSEAEVMQWCNQHRVKYLSTSVKTNLNVEESFMTLAKMVYEYQARQAVQRTETISLGKKDIKGKDKKRCCK